jgi:hypothetical protein
MGHEKRVAVTATPAEGTDLPPLASLYRCTISIDGKHRIGLGASRCLDY